MPSIKKSEVATVADALRELRNMQAQIIHGSRIFGDIADILEAESNRLEWLQKYCDSAEHPFDFEGEPPKLTGKFWRISHHDGNETVDATLREVVDSAMRDWPL